jgi:hypothetical protein
MVAHKPFLPILAGVALAVFCADRPAMAQFWVPPNARHSHAQDHTERTRTLPWPGGERLVIAVSADARYVQGNDAKVVITGPADEISDIVVDQGVIRHEQTHWGWGWFWGNWRSGHGVRIVVTAPRISQADVSGSGHLNLGRLSQDHLGLGVSGSGFAEASGDIRSVDVSVSGSGGARLTPVNAGDMDTHISGSGWVAASGAANTLHLSISGSGSADMSGLVAQDVRAGLSGSGSAKVAPKRSADLGVSGSGSIRLVSEPAQLNSHRSGSGSIIRPGGA